MTGPLRSSLGDAAAELSRSLGALAGLAWLCVVAGQVALSVGDVSIRGVLVPHELLWLGVFIAVLGAGWLADGSYLRRGPDFDGGWTFVWLAAFFVPFAFLPTRIALGALVGESGVADALFVLAATVAAGWLAVYGGLERLALESDDFLRVTVYAIALGTIPVAAVVFFDVAWLTDDRVVAAVAAVVQVGACWLGFASAGS